MPAPEDAGRRGTERRVWAAMLEFTREHEHDGNLRERLHLGLGAGRIRALLLLRDRPLSLGELAAAHAVDAPYATVIVDRLEALGYVARMPDPADRRRKLVTLTPDGQRAAALAEESLSAPPPPLRALTASELDALAGLLDRLRTTEPWKDRP